LAENFQSFAVVVDVVAAAVDKIVVVVVVDDVVAVVVEQHLDYLDTSFLAVVDSGTLDTGVDLEGLLDTGVDLEGLLDCTDTVGLLVDGASLVVALTLDCTEDTPGLG
jgi:hypothetical protein